MKEGECTAAARLELPLCLVRILEARSSVSRGMWVLLRGEAKFSIGEDGTSMLWRCDAFWVLRSSSRLWKEHLP